MSFIDGLPLLPGHPVRGYLESLAPGSSQETQWSAVQQVVRLFDGRRKNVQEFAWHEITIEDIRKLRRVLVEEFKPATGRRYLSALKGVLEQCWVEKLISAEQLQRLTHRRVFAPIRGSSKPPGRALSRGEALALFDVCAADRSHLGARDAAIFALLFGAGLRRAEVVTLDLADVDLETRTIQVRGKGRKDRQLPLPRGTALAIEEWVKVRGSWAGPLVVPLGYGVSSKDARRLSRSGVNAMLRKRAAKARLDDVMVHDFRRTYISDLLDAGRGLEVAARLAGHADVNTTAQYDRRTDERARAAVEDIEVPVQRVDRKLKKLKEEEDG